MKPLLSDLQRFLPWYADHGWTRGELADKLETAFQIIGFTGLKPLIAELRAAPDSLADKKHLFILWDMETNGEPLTCISRGSSISNEEILTRVARITGTDAERRLIEAREKQKCAQHAYIEACNVMEDAREKLTAADKKLAKLEAVKS